MCRYRASEYDIPLSNPRAKGYEHAESLIEEGLLDRYLHMNLDLFLPDADGNDRSTSFEALEKRATAAGKTLMCQSAMQEVEVWLLAGHVDKLDLPWQSVRNDPHVKERLPAFLSAVWRCTQGRWRQRPAYATNLKRLQRPARALSGSQAATGSHLRRDCRAAIASGIQ